MVESRGVAPRPKPPSPPLSLQDSKPGSSPKVIRLTTTNKLDFREGIDVLPENVFYAIAGILNQAGREELGAVTIQIVALDKPHLGLYGRWLVKML